ncbi:hypothetical protein ACFOGJ_27385 [Marinibaculum pumilum]|uniref:Uncharacterized protein n=1 Tax=Marinibaculum pumilum TaxID=1766165 RepID=A0ABV7L9N5_9PROT
MIGIKEAVMNRNRSTGRETQQPDRRQAPRPAPAARLPQGEMQAVAGGIIEVYPR